MLAAIQLRIFCVSICCWSASGLNMGKTLDVLAVDCMCVCGYGNWFLTLREEKMYIAVVWNRIVRGIFRSKREKVTGG
jgi:hypothetical protein